MQYTRLGSIGAKVSRICVGGRSFGNTEGWMLELEQARPIVKKALDLGINFFDTANVYSDGRTEEIVGELIKDYRDDMILATKVRLSVGDKPNDEGLSRVHILKQIDQSLERLQTDYIDVYYIHRWDDETLIEETLRTLDGLVQQGKVRYIAASNLWAWQLVKALWTSQTLGLERFEVMQIHYNLSYREHEREVIPLCQDQGLGIVTWGSLGKGILSAKYKQIPDASNDRYHLESRMVDWYYSRPEQRTILDRIEEVATEKGVKPAQISLAWLLHRGVTAPIVGFDRVEYVDEAVEAVEVKLSPSDMEYLEEPYHPREIIEL